MRRSPATVRGWDDVSHHASDAWACSGSEGESKAESNKLNWPQQYALMFAIITSQEIVELLCWKLFSSMVVFLPLCLQVFVYPWNWLCYIMVGAGPVHVPMHRHSMRTRIEAAAAAKGECVLIWSIRLRCMKYEYMIYMAKMYGKPNVFSTWRNLLSSGF